MNKPDLSVIIATYNERENIANIVVAVDKICKSNGIKEEILIVDDSSPDKTYEIARKLEKKYPNVKLILRKRKEGLGAALSQGYFTAKGNYIMSMDADFSHDPKEILKMYKKLNEGYDFVVGSRYIRGGKVVGKPAYKILISKVSALVASIILWMNFKDYTNNFRMFKRQALPKEFKTKGNILITELLYRAHQKGLKITEIPITFEERKAGKSKTRVLREIALFLIGVVKLRFNMW